MGKAERTTKLLLDLGDPQAGGANVGKREYLASTTRILNDARADLTWNFSWLTPTNSSNACN